MNLELQQKKYVEECEIRHKQQIEEYERNLQASVHEVKKLKSDLENLQENKQTNEKLLNELMISLEDDFRKQIEDLKARNNELEKNSSYSYSFLLLISFSD